MLISEMAVRENIPRRYFLRASKALSSSSWNATDYKLKIQSVDEMVRFLEQSPVKLIVRDTYPNPRIHYPHHDLLAGALAGSPQWEKVASFSGSATVARSPSTVIERKECVRNPSIEADLTRKINRSLSNNP